MILIQIILIISIVLILSKFILSRNSIQTQAWKKIFLLLFGLAAIVLVISPSLLDGMANAVGVGRGADLLLYTLTIAFIFEQFNNYIKSKEEHHKLTLLCRKIAITEARARYKNKTTK